MACGSGAPTIKLADPLGSALADAAINICVVKFAADSVSAALLAAHGDAPALRSADPPVLAATLDDSRTTVSSVAVALAAALFAADKPIAVVRLADPLVCALADASKLVPFAVRLALDAVTAGPLDWSAIPVLSDAMDAVTADPAAAIDWPAAVRLALAPVVAAFAACSAMPDVSAAVDAVTAWALAANAIRPVNAAVLDGAADALATRLIELVRLADAAEVAVLVAASVTAVESVALEPVEAELLAAKTAPVATPPAPASRREIIRAED